MAPDYFYPPPSPSTSSVCVMDASGHLGSALVRTLLQRGYAVHAAACHHNSDEMKLLRKISSENDRLRLFHADPLDYHSIMDAIRGCSGLFYSFELPSEQPTYDELMAELEVRAAHNVLEACAQTDTMDKVVFTSSATAVIWRDQNQTSTVLTNDVDERRWSDVNFCKKFKLWHGLSKTLAEKTAWALAMDRGVNMVSVNSGLLMCPHLTIKEPYLKGAAEMYKDGVFVTVDLKLLINAHICVFEDVSSYGRYLCFNRVINCNTDVVKLANTLLPPSHQNQSWEDTRLYEQKISNKKLSKLMVDFEDGVQVDDDQ